MDAYERGRRAGHLEGYEMAVVAYLLTMQNMFELEADDLYRLNMRIDFELQRIIRRGKPYFEMLKRQLRDDYGITFKWKEPAKPSKKITDIPLLECWGRSITKLITTASQRERTKANDKLAVCYTKGI